MDVAVVVVVVAVVAAAVVVKPWQLQVQEGKVLDVFYHHGEIFSFSSVGCAAWGWGWQSDGFCFVGMRRACCTRRQCTCASPGGEQLKSGF